MIALLTIIDVNPLSFAFGAVLGGSLGVFFGMIWING